MMETGFDELADLALRKSGQVFRRSQQYLIEGRLAHILRRENFSTLEELSNCLTARSNMVLEDEVVAALTSKETSFFSDRKVLSHIVDTLLPSTVRLKTAMGDETPIRILCAGGGTGQEAYSLAILLDEADDHAFSGYDIEILSIDICKASTERAIAGHYGHFEIQMGLSVHRMLSYFNKRDNSWCLDEGIRKRVQFEVLNLLDPLDSLGVFDMLLCRNVMSSMAAPIAKDLAQRLVPLLAPAGRLILGQGEVIETDVFDLEPSYDARNAWQRATDRKCVSDMTTADANDISIALSA